MNIRPDQIEGVRPEQQQKTNKVRKPGQDFGEMLNREISGAEKPAQTAGIAPPPIVNPLLNVAQVQQISKPAAATQQQAVQKMEGVLDKLDAYAKGLEGNGSLRDAYSALQGLAGDMQELKAMPGVADNPQLKAMSEELEAIAYTEQFKINRGDYL